MSTWPAGQDRILVYGYEVDLRGNLEPTGTGLDRSMFFTFETAHEIARLSLTHAVAPLEIPANSISAALVRVGSDADPHAIAQEIARRLPGVTPMESTNLFQSQRTQILGLLRSVVALTGIIWVLAVALVAIVFSIAVNERRRQIGVMRALGATRLAVLRSILAEAALLALGGGVVGITVAALSVSLFRPLLMRSDVRTLFVSGVARTPGPGAAGAGPDLGQRRSGGVGTGPEDQLDRPSRRDEGVIRDLTAYRQQDLYCW